MQSEERLWREIAAVESGGDALEFRVDLLDAAGAGAIERSFAKIRSSSSIQVFLQSFYSCCMFCCVLFATPLPTTALFSPFLSPFCDFTSLFSSFSTMF